MTWGEIAQQHERARITVRRWYRAAFGSTARERPRAVVKADGALTDAFADAWHGLRR
jgi:hypothetical protein